MLSDDPEDPDDAAIVRSWLDSALGSGDQRSRLRKELAEHCGVTVQAVDGWLRTGRIRKSHLERASDLLSSRPLFASSRSPTAREAAPAPSAPWPFKLVRMEEVFGLSPKRMARLDKALRDRLDEWYEDDAGKRRRAA